MEDELGKICSTNGEEKETAYRILTVKQEGKYHQEYQDIDEWIVLNLEDQELEWGCVD
jgi:hypothetical protein